MFRPQLRRITLRCEGANYGLAKPARQFSCTRTVAEEENQPSATRTPNPRPNTYTRRPHNPNGPPRSAQNQSRPPRVIDARSFAASKAGGGEQSKIIRSPRSPRTMRAGGQPPNRKPKPSAKGGKGKRNTPRRAKSSDNDDGEDAQAALIEQVQQEQITKARPTPVRYEPNEISFSTLKATWPSIPTDANARSAAIYQELSSSSGRIAGGYLPPHELGERLLNHQTVLFNSETEKVETLGEARRLAQHRADRKSQRTGEVMKPLEVDFSPLGTESKKTQDLMKELAQGIYPTSQNTAGYKNSVLNEVVKTLGNNGTYATHKKTTGFMSKLEGLFEPRASGGGQKSHQ